MSLGPSDTDGGTWGIAMTSHGPLDMIKRRADGVGPYFTGRSQLKPLGDKNAIKRYIDGLLLDARRANGGTLPGVVEYEVAGVPNVRLMVPTALGSSTCIALAEVARQGLGAVEGVTAALGDASYAEQTSNFEADWRRSHPDAEERDVRAAIAEHNRGREPNPAGMTSALRDILVTPQPGAVDENGDPITERTAAEANATIASARAVFNSNTYRADASAMTGAQHYAALATVLGSVAECAVDAATGNEYAQESADLDLTVSILETVAVVCDAVAGFTTSVPIAAAVFEILALACRLIAWIVKALRDYSISPLEGWDKEWDGTDCTLILKERLRILVQIEESVISTGPEGWRKHWEAAMTDLGINREEQFQLLTNYIYLTARRRDSGAPGTMLANAKGIAQVLGGRDATKSLNMCDDIANWLGYVGVPPEDCAAVRTWLYESRKVTVVRKRRKDLSDMVSRNTGRGAEYTGNMVTYVGGGPTGAASCEGDPENKCNILGGERSRCQVNFRAGADGWYRDCCGINVASSAEFVPFELADLEELWLSMRNRLRVVPFRGLNTSLPRGTLKDALLTGARKTALIKMLAPGATAEQIARCGVLNISAPGLAAMVLRDVPDSSLTPGVAGQSRLLNVGTESVRLWTTDPGFLVGGGGIPFYLRIMPHDVAAGTFRGPAEALPAGTPRLLSRVSDSTLRQLLWEQMGIGRDPNLEQSGGSGGGGTAVVAGLGVAAVVAAALLIK